MCYQLCHGIDTGKCILDNEDGLLARAIDSDGYYLQELADVSSEFRVLYMKGVDPDDYIVEYRTGYAPNSTAARKHTVLRHGGLLEYVSSDTAGTMRNAVRRLGDYVNTPALSVDVFVDTDGALGIFEHSTQFGIDYSRGTLADLSSQYTSAMGAAIKLARERRIVPSELY